MMLVICTIMICVNSIFSVSLKYDLMISYVQDCVYRKITQYYCYVDFVAGELIKAGCHDLCCPVSDRYKYSFDLVNCI